MSGSVAGVVERSRALSLSQRPARYILQRLCIKPWCSLLDSVGTNALGKFPRPPCYLSLYLPQVSDLYLDPHNAISFNAYTVSVPQPFTLPKTTRQSNTKMSGNTETFG